MSEKGGLLNGLLRSLLTKQYEKRDTLSPTSMSHFQGVNGHSDENSMSAEKESLQCFWERKKENKINGKMFETMIYNDHDKGHHAVRKDGDSDTSEEICADKTHSSPKGMASNGCNESTLLTLKKECLENQYSSSSTKESMEEDVRHSIDPNVPVDVVQSFDQFLLKPSGVFTRPNANLGHNQIISSENLFTENQDFSEPCMSMIKENTNKTGSSRRSKAFKRIPNFPRFENMLDETEFNTESTKQILNNTPEYGNGVTTKQFPFTHTSNENMYISFQPHIEGTVTDDALMKISYDNNVFHGEGEAISIPEDIDEPHIEENEPHNSINGADPDWHITENLDEVSDSDKSAEINQSLPDIFAPPLPKLPPKKRIRNSSTGKRVRKERYKIVNGKRYRECSQCAKLFRTRSELRAHNKIHKEINEVGVKIIDGKKWRECCECLKLFKTRKQLNIHFRIHSNEKPYSCEVCGKAFKQLAHMNSHMKIHSGEKPHSCDLCGMNFSERSSLKRHIRRHLGIKPFQCDICGQSFYTSTILKSHRTSHSIRAGEIEKFKCEFCDRQYSSKETLKKHSRLHEPANRITCEQCGNVFLTKGHLKRHIKSVHQKIAIPKIFSCGECGEDFPKKSLLTSHMTQIHKKNRRPYQCKECDRNFKTEFLLEKHTLSHTQKDKGKPHLCDLCGKNFSASRHLNRHMATHKDVHPFKCHVCYAVFEDENTLKEHTEKHGDQPSHLKCVHCEKTYGNKQSLLTHIYTRHPESDIFEKGNNFKTQEDKIIVRDEDGKAQIKFQCKECPKTFSRRDNLQSHMRFHNGTAYICTVCDKKFDKKYNFRMHQLSHTKVNTFACPHCPLKLRYHSCLQRHIFRRHKDCLQNGDCEKDEIAEQGEAKIKEEQEETVVVEMGDVFDVSDKDYNNDTDEKVVSSDTPVENCESE